MALLIVMMAATNSNAHENAKISMMNTSAMMNFVYGRLGCAVNFTLNNFCMALDLFSFFFADGFRNCADNSDELYCPSGSAFKQYVRDYGFLMLAAVLFVLLLIILSTFCFFRRRRRNAAQH